MTGLTDRLEAAADDLNVLVWGENEQAKEAQEALHAAVRRIESLSTLVDRAAPLDGRYVVLCDDGSLIATDELMQGDDVLIDRGEDY